MMDEFMKWIAEKLKTANDTIDENAFATDNQKDYAEGYADALSDVLGKALEIKDNNNNLNK